MEILIINMTSIQLTFLELLDKLRNIFFKVVQDFFMTNER